MSQGAPPPPSPAAADHATANVGAADAGLPPARPLRFVHRGAVVEVRDLPPTTSVLSWLREQQRCTGTKEGCNEGDCGACTVLVGERNAAGAVDWKPVNSCIQLLPMLDGKSVKTVESLRRADGTFQLSGSGIHRTYGPVNVTLDGPIDRPRVTVRLARPLPSAQLSDVTLNLVPTAAGRLYVEHGGGIWRLLTYVPGQCFAVMTKERAEPAGELVGRFHAAVQDCDHGFRFSRPGAHDLARHLATLAAAVERVRGADPGGPALLAQEREGFLDLADEVARRAAELPSAVPGPLRLCHGDLKLNNLRFDDAGRGVCLLDLDTLARLPLGLELGDALRSWCNPLGEDDVDARFDLGLFERALRGYAVHARAFIRPEERAFLVRGVERVALQLAARFGADVVNQSYFRWNPQRFASRAAHNLIRARSQLGVARSLDAQRSGAEALVDELLG